jgi:Flp pilus assembly protein TadG
MRMAERLTRCRARTAKGIARLRQDRRGSALIEFAVCAGAFMALLVACAQTALVFFAQQGVQTAAEDLARKVMTGQVRSGSTSQSDFRQAACASLPGYMKCSRLFVDVRTANAFSAIDTSGVTLTYDKDGKLTNSWAYNTGNAGDVVVLRLMYLWPTSTGPLGFNLSNQSGSTRLISGTMVFKSEPFA